GYRAPRRTSSDPAESLGPARPVAVVTGEYGAAVLAPLLEGRRGNRRGGGAVRLVPVRNAFFGGNIAVTGLMTGADVARALACQPHDERYLLPDVCLSEGRFLDGMTVAELPRPVEVVPSDGYSLRVALDGAPP
ncbi:MAG TPA: DUF512 domain-containing protein, partial [Acidimicrobiales bacterium]|nr:DUF512 domain-containing protein [Acidimicrobiales bacterium]